MTIMLKEIIYDHLIEDKEKILKDWHDFIQIQILLMLQADHQLQFPQFPKDKKNKKIFLLKIKI